MKTFCVPLVQSVFSIYYGEEGWERFKRAAITSGAYEESPDAPYPGKNTGRAFGSRIWVWSLSDRGTLIHELSHFIDDLMSFLHSTENEFRAYCTAWIIDTVLTWAEKQQ